MGGLSSLAGDLTGGIIGESSAEKAAKNAKKRSEKATAEAVGFVNSAWDYLDTSLTPYAEVGAQNLADIGDLSAPTGPDAPQLQQFDFTAADLKTDPSYNFRLSQGLQAVDRVSARNRNLTSGNRITGLTDYAQGAASQEYAAAWQRAFKTNFTNNRTLSDQFDIANKQYGNQFEQFNSDLSRKQYLADTGFGATQKLSDYNYRTNVDKGNLVLGNAANSTAADMFVAQNKSQFVSDAAGVLGSYLGAR